MGQSSNVGKWIGLMLAALAFVVFALKLNAQTPLQGQVKPNVAGAMKARAANGSRSAANKERESARKSTLPLRPRQSGESVATDKERRAARVKIRGGSLNPAIERVSSGPITPGASLARVLHTSQLSLISSAGSNEQYFDSAFDLVADQRQTFDSDGGSFDIAVGKSGVRYAVYSAIDDRGTATPSDDRRTGILVTGTDSNGDFSRDSSASFDLGRDFNLPSAVAVVTGTAISGREFVIVSSSGYFNSANPSDPENEQTAGVVLLVRNQSNTGFDNTLSRSLVAVGSNRIFNANALALLPNNDLLIADFDAHELRIVRDTNHDGMPETLDSTPYFSYQFSDDGPLDVAANSRGVVFSHGYGANAVMLALYDTNNNGYADTEETVVEGLSLDNNLIWHGLTVDREGNVYVVEDASGAADTTADGGNLGTPAIDLFPDPALNGFLREGAVFVSVDQPDSQALSGLGFGVDPTLGNVGRLSVTNSASRTGNATYDGLATVSGANLTFGATGMTEADAAQSGVYVSVEGVFAKVLSFNNNQINIHVPNSVGAGVRSVLVFKNDDIIAAEDVTVSTANPGVFTGGNNGSGQAVALLASALRYTMGPFAGTTNGQPSVVVIYGTGWRNSLPVTATIGGKPATVQYAGPAGDFPGLDLVNVAIPPGASGNSSVVVTAANGASSRTDVVIAVN